MPLFLSSPDIQRLAPHGSSRFGASLSPRFPFGVFYTIEPDAVVLHGVLHSSRDPDKIRRLLESGGDEPMV